MQVPATGFLYLQQLRYTVLQILLTERLLTSHHWQCDANKRQRYVVGDFGETTSHGVCRLLRSRRVNHLQNFAVLILYIHRSQYFMTLQNSLYRLVESYLIQFAIKL